MQRSIGRLERCMQLVAITVSVAIVLAVICFAVFGGLEGRDDARDRRMRQDIQALRQMTLQLQSKLANRTALLQPIGFSVHKAASQSVPFLTFAAVTGWSTSGGNPAYDASGGGFNAATGIFTAAVATKYQVDASVCWAPGSSGSRIAVLINSASAAMHVFDFESYGGIGNSCNILTVVYDLLPGDTVFVLVIHTSPGAQTITTDTTFSIERITVP